jgi:HTH-type transcriptional regulator / antitoxin HipB
MSDIEKFITERKVRSSQAWANFEDNYRKFAIGMLLAEHREKSGLTLSQFAKRVKMQKTALSRLENHGEDVRLSTITRYVEATGRSLQLNITPSGKRRLRGRKLSASVELVSA